MRRADGGALRGLDILVNNHAVQFIQRSILDISQEQLSLVFQNNVYSFFYLIQAALPHLHRRSTIIKTTSVTAYQGNKGLIDYSATKGAMRQFTKGMAIEWAPYNIQVNAIMPGTIVTGFNPNQLDPAWRAQAVKRVPAGRLGAAEDCAGTAVFLASSASDYVTGVSIAVDGGILAGA